MFDLVRQKIILSDNTAKCSLSAPPSKGKRVAICYGGSSEGFAPNALLLCGNMELQCKQE